MKPPQKTYQNPPRIVEAEAMLASLREAVAQALERKRRLGRYAVQWENGHPVALLHLQCLARAMKPARECWS